jgi:hypothetical protein
MAAVVGKLAAALHPRTRRVTSTLAHATLECVLFTLLLNQQPTHLCHRHVHGLLWASSGTGKGAPSRSERRRGSSVRTDAAFGAGWARALRPDVRVLVSPIKKRETSKMQKVQAFMVN